MKLAAIRVTLCMLLGFVFVFNMPSPWDVFAVILVAALIATHRYEVREEERKQHARDRVQEVLPPV